MDTLKHLKSAATDEILEEWMLKNCWQIGLTIHHKPWCVNFEKLLSHLNTQARHNIIQERKNQRN